MFSAEFVSRTAGVLEELDWVLDKLADLDLSAGSDADLIELMTGVEQRSRRFAVVDHALIAETEARGLAIRHGCANTTAFVTRLLGIGAGQATLRVRAARQLSPRRALSGERLPAEFAATATALAEGAISVEHARVITSTIRALPPDVREENFDQIETELAGYARQRTAGRIPDRLDSTVGGARRQPNLTSSPRLISWNRTCGRVRSAGAALPYCAHRFAAYLA